MKNKILYFIILCLIFLIFPLDNIKFNNTLSNKTENNNILLEKEYSNMNSYIYNLKHDIMINNYQRFSSVDPKISIVIALYNGQNFIKRLLLSIYNQNFKEIEIIFVNDYSIDNSSSIINEYMKKDKRIKLYENKDNKGILYSKSKGVLKSKGKYVMILDQDDIYTQYDVFSTLYYIAENKNLDILGFSFVFGYNNLTLIKGVPDRFFETPVLFQPKVFQMDHNITSNGEVKRMNLFLWNYFIRSDIFKKSIKQIDDKFMKTKMIAHDDFMLFFVLVRNAYKMQLIKRIFYANIINTKKNYPNIKNPKNKENAICNSLLNYIEFVLMKTNNTFHDKKIASFEFNQWFLNHNCRNNLFIRKKGIYVSNLFIKNKYIDKKVKAEIKFFLEKQNKKQLV